jgi:hypothetical protein
LCQIWFFSLPVLIKCLDSQRKKELMPMGENISVASCLLAEVVEEQRKSGGVERWMVVAACGWGQRSGIWGWGSRWRMAPMALIEPPTRPAGQRASLSASRNGARSPSGVRWPAEPGARLLAPQRRERQGPVTKHTQGVVALARGSQG